MHTFFHGIFDHKDRFLAPVVKSLHSCCTPSLWGDSSGPHRFSHAHSRGLSKKEPSLLPQSIKEEQHVLQPKLFAPETHSSLFSFLVTLQEENKTTGWRRSDYFFHQSPKWRQWKAPHQRHLCGRHRPQQESSHVRRAFINAIMGQSTVSVPRLMGRNRTFWCIPRCWSQTACPLCFIRSSEIHWPSSIAQKGSISKPCPLRLGPGPLSVGKVFVAFVQVHRTQTAARQGQAADLYSRLRQSMAAPAQTQEWFEQQPCVYTVKGFLLLVCSHYLGSH